MLNDMDREENLISLGVELIRFPNDLIFDDTELVIKQIREKIESIKSSGSPLQGI